MPANVLGARQAQLERGDCLLISIVEDCWVAQVGDCGEEATVVSGNVVACESSRARSPLGRTVGSFTLAAGWGRRHKVGAEHGSHVCQTPVRKVHHGRVARFGELQQPCVGGLLAHVAGVLTPRAHVLHRAKRVDECLVVVCDVDAGQDASEASELVEEMLGLLGLRIDRVTGEISDHAESTLQRVWPVEQVKERLGSPKVSDGLSNGCGSVAFRSIDDVGEFVHCPHLRRVVLLQRAHDLAQRIRQLRMHPAVFLLRHAKWRPSSFIFPSQHHEVCCFL